MSLYRCASVLAASVLVLAVAATDPARAAEAGPQQASLVSHGQQP